MGTRVSTKEKGINRVQHQLDRKSDWQNKLKHMKVKYNRKRGG